jgi:hypothetical protein
MEWVLVIEKTKRRERAPEVPETDSFRILEGEK